MRMRLVWTAVAAAACACGTGGEPPAADRQAGGAGTPSGETDPWQAAKARGVEFRALGQEPGWYLEIDEGASMRLVYDYGEREATTPVPPPAVADKTTTYEAKTEEHILRVVIEEQECGDVMSGLRFPRTVTVTIDNRVLQGCGQEL